MAVDLSPYTIADGAQDYPVKYNAMLGHIETEINLGLGQITTNLGTLSAQITSELNAAVAEVEVYRDAAADSAVTSAEEAAAAALSEVAALGYLTETQNARDQAIAIVYGGEYSINAGAGKVPIADTDARLGTDWLPIGTAPNQIPLNQFLGRMAYQSPENVVIRPRASVTPAGAGDMAFQLTSDTSLVIKVKGSDGTVRSTTLTLA